MKTTIYSLLCIVVLSLISFESQAKPNGVHPRLFLKAGEEKSLMQGIESDTIWLSIHQRIIQECDTLLIKQPQQRIKVGKRLLQTSRTVLRSITYLSYAYRLTKDTRYAYRAEQEMLAAARFSDWNPGHFLDVGELMMAMAIGYDWLFDFLPPASRKEISEAIYHFGLEESYKNTSSWVKGDNNWNQVCHGGTVVAALALADEYPQICNSLIDRAIQNVPYALQAYAPDGAYPEGPGYWEYGTSYTALMLDALESCSMDDLGLSASPGFLPSALYSQQMITPTQGSFSYADNGTSSSFSPAVFYFYKKTKDSRLLFNQRALYLYQQKKATPSYAKHRFLPFAVLWGVQSGASLQKSKPPKQLFYIAYGDNPVAVMRSNWTSRSALYLGVKVGRANTNHGHMDVGSFFYQSQGVRWALDMGAENYTTIEAQNIALFDRKQKSARWQIYRYNNFQHNTLTVNHKLHSVSGKATWIGVENENTNLMSVQTDLTEVFSKELKQVVRTCAMINRSEILVHDSIVVGSKDAIITWNMMTEASEIEQIAPGVFKLTKGKAVEYMQVNIPFGFKFLTGLATPPTSYENQNKGISYVRFEFTAPAGSCFAIKVQLGIPKPV